MVVLMQQIFHRINCLEKVFYRWVEQEGVDRVQLNVLMIDCDYATSLIALIKFWVKIKNTQYKNQTFKLKWLNVICLSNNPAKKARVLDIFENQELGVTQLDKMLLRQWPVNAEGVQYIEIPTFGIKVHIYIGCVEKKVKEFNLSACWVLINLKDTLTDEFIFRCKKYFLHGSKLLIENTNKDLINKINTLGFESHFGVNEFLYKNPVIRKTKKTITPKSVAIIGAGIAGSSVAFELCRQGVEVSLFEAQDGPAQGSSGNWVGAFHPHFTRDDNFLSHLTRLGCSHTVRQLLYLTELGFLKEAEDWQQPGHLQLIPEDKQEIYIQSLKNFKANDDWVRWSNYGQAFNKSPAGLWFLSGGWVKPVNWVKANLHACGKRLEVHYKQSLSKLPSGFDAVVIAGAQHSLDLIDQPAYVANQVKGQVTLVKKMNQLPCVLSGQTYAIDAHEDWLLLGATYERPATHLRPTDQANQINLNRFSQACPEFALGSILNQRCGVRSVWPDRLPAIGPIEKNANIYLNTGFASRGLTWSAMAAWQITRLLGFAPNDGQFKLYDKLLPMRYLK